MKKKVQLRKRQSKYPSAAIVHSACYEDYKRCLDTYDKIYEKINIALAFCGIILLVILSSFDYTNILKITQNITKLELFSLLLYLICSAVSIICIVWSVIKLLLMLRSRTVTVFDSIACRNEKVYELIEEDAALWLIDKYTIAINELKIINNKKHKEYNAVIIKIVISLLAYAVVITMNRGV